MNPRAQRSVMWCGLFALASSGCAGILGDAKLEAPSKAPNTAAGLICDVVIDDFQQVAVGAFPEGWETFDKSELPEVRASGAFQVQADGAQHVLRARAVGEAVGLGHGIHGWDMQRYPYLTWRWKAVTLPKGADETKSELDDTAASVQGVWLIGFPFMVRTLRYTWSSTLPTSTRASNRLGHDQLVVLESGTEHRNQWRQATVNVLEHYQQWFGMTDAAPPTGISIQTDADSTQTSAEALYADFRLCRKAEDAVTPSVPAQPTSGAKP
jgi:Protein of unknown function (DUF3047)